MFGVRLIRNIFWEFLFWTCDCFIAFINQYRIFRIKLRYLRDRLVKTMIFPRLNHFNFFTTPLRPWHDGHDAISFWMLHNPHIALHCLHCVFFLTIFTKILRICALEQCYLPLDEYLKKDKIQKTHWFVNTTWHVTGRDVTFPLSLAPRLALAGLKRWRDLFLTASIVRMRTGKI